MADGGAAPALPVARVAVDSGLAHLDRAFDYAVPPALDDARRGCRVRVRFAGRLVDGLCGHGTVPGASHDGRRPGSPRLAARNGMVGAGWTDCGTAGPPVWALDRRAPSSQVPPRLPNLTPDQPRGSRRRPARTPYEIRLAPT